MAHVAYIQWPRWARWAQRILFAGFYSLVLASGLRAFQIPEPRQWHGLLLDGSGWVMAVGAVVCMIGVASKYYNVEMVGLYFSCSGLCAGAVWASTGGAWYLVYTILALACGLGLRLLQLALIAREARTERYFTQGP